MIAFITSETGHYTEEERLPARWNEANGFLQNVRAHWPAGEEGARCLLVCTQYTDHAMNDGMKDNLAESLRLSGLTAHSLALCDSRNALEFPALLAASDVVVFSGGHTGMGNRFFRILDMARHIRSFDGMLITISGGSMNSGELSYITPEWEGLTPDADPERFQKGLSLTEINILPHYGFLKTLVLDGKRMIGDIVLPDSRRPEARDHTWYALPDESYLILKTEGPLATATQKKTTLMGEAHRIHNGTIEQVSREGDVVVMDAGASCSNDRDTAGA